MAVYPNDMLHPTFLMGAIQERPDSNAIKQNYIGQTLLPDQEVPERRLMWDSMVSENNLAGFYSSKGHAIPGDDVMFSSHFADLVDVKASRYLDPDIVGKIRDPGMPAVIKAAGESNLVRGLAQRVQTHVRDNLAWCDDAVDAQKEWMIIHALIDDFVWPPKDANGNQLSGTDAMPHWNANESISLTFPLLSTFKQNASTLSGYGSRSGGGYNWKNDNADPIKDLEVIAELMVETKGLEPGTIILSRSTLSWLAFQPNVLRWIRGTNYEQNDTRNYAEIQAVKDFISTRLGYTIVTYDAQWTYRVHNAGTKPTINRVKFLPEGKVIILPNAAQPGFFAQSPHETQDGNYQVGKIPWVYREPIPPYERQMGVNLVGFPVLTRPEEHFVLDVYA